MKLKLLCPWLLCCLIAPSLFAQVEVRVLMDQAQFLPGERLPIKLRIVNHSGQTLVFGEDNSWLDVSVEAADDATVVSRTGQVPVAGVFELPPSKMATKPLNLAPYFKLDRPGRYSIQATVRVQGWKKTITSPPKGFDVIAGTKLWEQVFGVPNPGHPDQPPAVRKYLLQEANYVKGPLRLYVRVTDASEEQTYRVAAIGPMISFSDPQVQLDARSRLHLLYQSGPRLSTYCVVDTEGNIVTRELFEYTTSRPRLSAAEDGSIRVSGGTRLRSNQEATSPQNPKSDG